MQAERPQVDQWVLTLNNLHSCQVVCSDEAAVYIRRKFRSLANAIVDGFYPAGSSEKVVTEGRIRWRGVELDWSIYWFDRTELYGWNEFGYPEDFMLRLFVSLSLCRGGRRGRLQRPLGRTNAGEVVPVT